MWGDGPWWYLPPPTCPQVIFLGQKFGGRCSSKSPDSSLNLVSKPGDWHHWNTKTSWCLQLAAMDSSLLVLGTTTTSQHIATWSSATWLGNANMIHNGFVFHSRPLFRGTMHSGGIRHDASRAFDTAFKSQISCSDNGQKQGAWLCRFPMNGLTIWVAQRKHHNLNTRILARLARDKPATTGTSILRGDGKKLENQQTNWRLPCRMECSWYYYSLKNDKIFNLQQTSPSPRLWFVL